MEGVMIMMIMPARVYKLE